ncbi:protein-L-isoaspartate O-methyltransferase family protein [Ruania alba]|uniref:Protein-L-isoaspartate O-methyltransferase n=1 Tax=Ruania alba TaxID=648782 RepID=A0A1H5M6A7_9MICO|nr:protein-L-isoaspartate carboxylmethyltransferase [Ruania alba]SEE84287.1 protein-L-isoaspartate(D-aspartate) O-methyltransferase [Ruania alba]
MHASDERTAERAVDRAFAAAPRSAFLPPDQRDEAPEDRPIGIGEGQTCSQPSTVRAMLLLLAVAPGARVLDLGSGSAWTTALLAHLVGPTGRVDGVERRHDLAAWGRDNLQTLQLPWAQVHTARADVLGWPQGAPYDRILVSATAPRLPESLLDQLADGGRMVIPVRTTMTVVDRVGAELRQWEAGQYRFVPLIVPESR